MNNTYMNCLSCSNGNVAQCDYEGSKDQSNEVGTQAPPGFDGGIIFLNSSSTPFQVNDL